MVIVRVALTEIERFLVVEPRPSLARTVKLEVPLVVGVPEIMPVDDASESPVGSEPEARDQE